MADLEPGACCCGGPIFLISGIGLLISGVQRYLLYQKIKNTPTSKVRSAAVGMTELFGKARCVSDMMSPVSKVRSPYWRIHGEYYKSGKNGGWRNIFNESSSSLFFLEDDTGRMLIDPKNAEIEIPIDLQTTGHLSDKGFLGFPLKKMDDRALSFIQANERAKSAFNTHSGAELRLTEYYIADGDPLYVFGNATIKKDPASAIAHENLIMKHSDSQTLFISDSGEKKVVDSMWWSILGMLALGMVFSAIGLILTFISIPW